MKQQAALQTILHFFLTKIIIGIAVIAGVVVFMEWFGGLLLDQTALSDVSKNLIISVANSGIALLSYILLFRWYENRRVAEFAIAGLPKHAATGFATGLILQSFFILTIYIAGGYTITQINAASSLLPAFADSLTAGFVAEIIIMGIVFRLTEETFGTVITLVTITLLFAILHINAPGATFISICATAAQAGLMLGAAYVFSRSLWLPIFMHFGWDFAEPGIFGGANPGINIQQHLFTSTISGSPFLTGGQSGPQNSIQGLILCLLTGFTFLWLAKKKNNFISPYWKK